MSSESDPRVVAFHLPQFHPIPENDAWWGAGFTEWTNTAKARRLFPGHRQPHLPADLGFYDLRLPESRFAQAVLAQEHGVTAFCYWHYWFGGGRRILERPVAEIVASGEPDMPFCLGWANQTWSGTWHGAPNTVLMEQTYPGPDDDRAHFDAVLPALTDPRYLTVDGRPVFYVFRPEEIPDVHAWVDRWRAMAAENGLPGLYLVAEMSDLLGAGPKCVDPVELGFDAGVYIRLPAANTPTNVVRMRAGRKLLGGPEVYPYRDVPHPLPERYRGQPIFPAIYPNWDNTPRSTRRGLVLTGTSPQRFERHVAAAAAHARLQPRGDERFVFIKSWNEWAEGNYLEPDLEHGRGWLEALQRGLRA